MHISGLNSDNYIIKIVYTSNYTNNLTIYEYL